MPPNFVIQDVEGARWLAPEIIDQPDSEADDDDDDDDDYATPFTVQSDVYSLGMTILEVCNIFSALLCCARLDHATIIFILLQMYTGRPPFAHRRLLSQVIIDIVENRHPGRPQPEDAPQLVDEMWTMIQSCWVHEPEGRPMAEFISNLAGLLYQMEVEPVGVDFRV